jgi:hypothetical protein
VYEIPRSRYADQTHQDPERVKQRVGRVFLQGGTPGQHASMVLNAHTNMNGLSGPIQLTNEKLKMRIMTPVISIDFRFIKTNPFTFKKFKAAPAFQ